MQRNMQRLPNRSQSLASIEFAAERNTCKLIEKLESSLNPEIHEPFLV